MAPRYIHDMTIGAAIALLSVLCASAPAHATWTNASPDKDYHCSATTATKHHPHFAMKTCVGVHLSANGAWVQGAAYVVNRNDHPALAVASTEVKLDGAKHRSDTCGPTAIGGGRGKWCYGKTTLISGRGASVLAIGYLGLPWRTRDVVASMPWPIGVAPSDPSVKRPSWVPEPYWPLLTRAAAGQRLDARLLAAQLKIESSFRATICSRAGACGIAQFLPGTWRGSWNPYRDRCGPKGYDDPTCAIPAQAVFMARLLATARTRDVAAIRARMARRGDIPASALSAINWGDPYQIALMAYHSGWGLDGWGPRTARYPVNIAAQARRG
jgi:hypothetical protein